MTLDILKLFFFQCVHGKGVLKTEENLFVINRINSTRKWKGKTII
jgi:hypothetical protein